MKHAVSLLALLAASALAPARDLDLEARAAIALSLASAKSQLCLCSLSGTCNCTDARQCDDQCITYGRYRWVGTNNANQTALYEGGVQKGNWWHAEGEYRRMDEDGDRVTWHKAECPVPSPVARPTIPASTYRPQMLSPITIAPVFRPQTFRPAFAPRSFGGGSRSGGC
jgi:hypothetical protein